MVFSQNNLDFLWLVGISNKNLQAYCIIENKNQMNEEHKQYFYY